MRSNNPSAEVIDTITTLARDLIRIPSRGGIDTPANVINAVTVWCDGNTLPHTLLHTNDGGPVGLYLRVQSGNPGPVLCLDACLDTAPFGEEERWTHAPTAGDIADGRLYGRGAADSKTAVAMFLVLMAELCRTSSLEQGDLYLLLDADEHTGKFGGVREFLRVSERRPDVVWIGYPGNHTVVAGSRGFLRAVLSVSGLAAHTGSKRRKGVNAVSRAARLIASLDRLDLPTESDPEFLFGPSLSVTAVHGGEGFSVVPDNCTVNLDARLTPNADEGSIRRLIDRAVTDFDRTDPGPKPTAIRWIESWPAFREPDSSPAIRPLREAAERVFGRVIPTTVSGPSNIGNYLASLGIPAMAGFGVTYDNVHATDEWCELDSIAPVYAVYRDAITSFAARQTARPE